MCLVHYLQPELSSSTPECDSDCHTRAKEASRCQIRSTLIMPLYTESGTAPVAVFELAQHEPGVDFSLAVGILQTTLQVTVLTNTGHQSISA